MQPSAASFPIDLQHKHAADINRADKGGHAVMDDYHQPQQQDRNTSRHKKHQVKAPEGSLLVM